jgi:hypothetical protein
MYSYPLKFKTSDEPSDAPLTVLDAEKNPVLFREMLSEDVQNGTAPCVVYTDKDSRQPLYRVLAQKEGGEKGFFIYTPGDTLLGKLVVESEHAWTVQDEMGRPVAAIAEKAAWKGGCLMSLLSLIDDDFTDTVLKLLVPHRYVVSINEAPVLTLREGTSTIHDDFNLKKSGEYTEREEALLLVSLMMIL